MVLGNVAPGRTSRSSRCSEEKPRFANVERARAAPCATCSSTTPERGDARPSLAREPRSWCEPRGRPHRALTSIHRLKGPANRSRGADGPDRRLPTGDGRSDGHRRLRRAGPARQHGALRGRGRPIGGRRRQMGDVLVGRPGKSRWRARCALARGHGASATSAPSPRRDPPPGENEGRPPSSARDGVSRSLFAKRHRSDGRQSAGRTSSPRWRPASTPTPASTSAPRGSRGSRCAGAAR